MVRVQNFGTPISGRDLDPVFRPPGAIDGRRRKGHAPEDQPLGLGLFVAKEIAAAHGDTNTVVSNQDAGTVFTATLPHGIPLLA